MPKKTRRQKIIAQLKRQLQMKNGQNLTATQSLPVQQSKVEFQNQIHSYHHQPIRREDDYSYVIADLKRIVLITLGSLAFEGFLYYWLNFSQTPRH